jgi:parallel beta-helix repeat protein
MKLNKMLILIEILIGQNLVLYSKLIKHRLYFLTIVCLAGFNLMAQPSGGPYGPVYVKYTLPAVLGKIYFVSVDGQQNEPGTTFDKPTTLEAAIERVVTDDAIIMRGGTYRTGNLLLNQGIIIQPYADEQPVLKGTLVATEWKDLGNGLWTTHWDHFFPSAPADWWQRERQGKQTPLYRFNNDMVFVDGKFLQAVGWEGDVTENTYYIDYTAGLVYIGADPVKHMVEITAYDAALVRVKGECHGKTSDHKGPVIKGITFTQYAYRALEVEGTEPEGLSPEAEHGKEVIGTLLENCTISFCSRVAAYLRGDRLTIRNCKITDTSTEGIYIIASSDVLLEKNIFTRNNMEQITGYFPAAVKIFNQCYRVTCRDNLVTDLPFSNGIWYDVGNVDGVFINNWVQNVGNNSIPITKERPWPSDNGFFFEISRGAVCAGNVFVNCDHGMWVLNSNNVTVCQNTFINSIACFGRDGRSAVGDHFGWHPSTGPDVDKREGHVFINNVLYGDQDLKRPLLYVWQNPVVCDRLKNSQLKQIDYNLFADNPEDKSFPLIYWSPAKSDTCLAELNAPSELNRMFPEFMGHSLYLDSRDVQLFRSPELGNYQLRALPKTAPAVALPADIRKLLGIGKNVPPYCGAYQSY